MSWQQVGAVQRLNLKMTPKMILLICANETSTDGENISIAVDTIALLAGCTSRIVQRYLRAFEYDQVLIETPDKVGRGRCNVWRLDVERARQLYGVIPTFRERKAAKEKGEPPSPFSQPGKGEPGSQKGEPGSQKGERGSPIPIKDPIQSPCGVASDAAAEGAAPTDEPPDQETKKRPRPAFYRIWSDKRGEIIDQFGEQVWRGWLKDLRPWPPAWAKHQLGDAYEAEAYYLNAPSRLIRDYIGKHYLAQLEPIVGQPLRLVYRNHVPDYWQRIEAMAEREQSTQAGAA